MRKIIAFTTATLALCWGSAVQAAACTGESPFTDVPASATYCTSAEWLANRGITIGCGDTTFCPNDYVTRAQMALFMNRLAEKELEAPRQIANVIPSMDLTSFASDNIVCTSQVIGASRNYPRVATITWYLSIAPLAAAAIGMLPYYSRDSGITWSQRGTALQFMAPASGFGHLSIPLVIEVPAGTTLRVGLGAYAPFNAVTTGGNMPCTMVVQVQSVTGIVAPFDQPAAGG